MKVSVIIPTYQGEKKIGSLLDALQKQTFTDFELIIVIDGSTDNTIHVIEKYKNLFQSFMVLEQENMGRAVVRNRGARKASNDILIFYDDDMKPFPDSVKRHLTFHQMHLGLCGGNQYEQFDVNNSDINNYKAHLSKKWMEKYNEGLNKLNDSNLFFTAANSSITRETFNKLNGFDERLTDAEDFNLAYRALEMNIPVYFDKDNLAIHHDYITCYSYIERLRQYTAAQQQLHLLFPSQFPNREVRKRYKTYFYGLFAFNFWPAIIDKNWLMILPKFLRFKIYEWVIYSLGVANGNKPIHFKN